MKKTLPALITICYTSLIGVSSMIAGESPHKEHLQMQHDIRNPFVHATYLVGRSIRNKAQLDHTRFGQFIFIYLMAAPPWTAADFDMPANDVMQKLVRSHDYPAGDSGLALVPELIRRAHRADIKVLLSIPGSKEFNPIAGNSEKRALFAKVMAAFVEKHDYDGIEIDWEHTVDLSQHAALMADLRTALMSLNKPDGFPGRRYYLTTALNSYQRYSRNLAQALGESIDWVNIMTYDLGGGIWGQVPGHNTPLDVMKKNLRTNWSAFPPDKLCIGLANYGFYYKGISPGEKGPLKEKGRYFSYRELPALLEAGWQESYDTKAEAPYYFSPDKTEFVTIDNNRSLERKLEWVFEEQYRGVFWWEFHSDYFPPVEGQEYASHPLIDHVTGTINTFEQENAPDKK